MIKFWPRASPPFWCAVLLDSGAKRLTCAEVGLGLLMLTAQQLREFCLKIPPFNVLTPQQLTELLDSSRQRSYAMRDIIFCEAEDGDIGYLILSGRVAMLKSSPNGRQMIMELLPAGELFGIIALIDQRPYPLTARAQSATTVLGIPRAAVKRVAAQNPEIFQGLLSVVSGRLLTAHNVSRALAHDRVEVRIASALLALREKDSTVVDIGRQELAELTGTTIESASRVCKAFERQAILDLSETGKVNLLDLPGLQAATEQLE